MKSIVKSRLSLLAICLTAVLYSCNNNTPKQETTPAPDTTKSVVAAPVVTPVAPKVVDIMEISHTVKDYAVWRKAFDEDSVVRKANGLELIAMGRNLDNPNNISVALNVSDLSKAKAFAADPRLKYVMQKNGVISKPEINYYHIERINLESKEKTWVLVTHKVKDYKAWLKVFDGEGTAGRAAQGLVDVVVSRDLTDSNTVHIVFDIKDLAKAKAEIGSEAKKKLMMSAGVIGKPRFEFYNTAQ